MQPRCTLIFKLIDFRHPVTEMITGMNLIEWQLSVSRPWHLVMLKAHVKDRLRLGIHFHTPKTRSPASVMHLKHESTLKNPSSEFFTITNEERESHNRW